MKLHKKCPACDSDNQYFRSNIDAVGGMGPDLLPGTGGLFGTQKMHAVVCKNCGFIRYFATEATLERISSTHGWEKL